MDLIAVPFNSSGGADGVAVQARSLSDARARAGVRVTLLARNNDILAEGQLVFLQRKRKTGPAAFHTVQKGEDLYSICQAEGMRFESLLELNNLGYFNRGTEIRAPQIAFERIW